jgi:hypothetical protein
LFLFKEKKKRKNAYKKRPEAYAFGLFRSFSASAEVHIDLVEVGILIVPIRPGELARGIPELRRKREGVRLDVGRIVRNVLPRGGEVVLLARGVFFRFLAGDGLRFPPDRPATSNRSLNISR